MTHKPNDLEVRYENRIVGWLHGFDGTAKVKMISLDIHTPVEGGEGFSESIIDNRVFILVRVNYSISARDLYDKPGSEREASRHVAPYAEAFKEAMSDRTTYHWRVVKLADFEEYEWIFDHHCFVPADAPLDFELIKDEKRAYTKVGGVWDEGAALIGAASDEDYAPPRVIDEGTLTVDEYREAMRTSWDLPIRKSDALLTTSSMT